MDPFTRFGIAMHGVIFRASNGRLLNRMAGMPVVMLSTTGRKSGARRSTMLTSPVQDGDRIVVVASSGGSDRHPAWFLNLRENPEVEATFRGRSAWMRARMASPEERAALWPRVTETYRGYAGYQRRTDREIPLVILEP